MGNALPAWWDSPAECDPYGLGMQTFRRCGPLRLSRVELDKPESVELILKILQDIWVNSQHKRHVVASLELAAAQQRDVVDQQLFFDKKEFCGGRQSDVWVSHISIRVAGIRTLSEVGAMNSGDVYQLIQGMGVGWFSAYDDYASSFRRNGINGPLLRELCEDDLTELGVTNRLHRRRIQLEIKSLEQGRSCQTFEIVVCSVGFSSKGNLASSKAELEEMLMQEIRNACKQQELLHSNGSIAQPANCLPAAKGVRHNRLPLDSPIVDLSYCTQDAAIAPDTVKSSTESPRSLSWRVGDEVVFYANGRLQNPVDGIVAKVHTNGSMVKVQYTDASGGQEVTPWVVESDRLHRKLEVDVKKAGA